MSVSYYDAEFQCPGCGKKLNVSDFVEKAEADWDEQSPAPFTSTSFSGCCPNCDEDITITVSEEPIEICIDAQKMHKVIHCGGATISNTNSKQLKNPLKFLKRRKD